MYNLVDNFSIFLGYVTRNRNRHLKTYAEHGILVTSDEAENLLCRIF